MKKISIIIASLVLFTGFSFASSYQQAKQDAKAKTEKKSPKKKEVKKVPARKTVTNKPAAATSTPKQ